MKREQLYVWGRKIGVLLGALTCCWSAAAAEYVWTGAEDGYWTNAANWTVSGAVATQPPGQVDLPDGTVGGDLGDTAVFSQASANTTINLAGHHSIFHVTVTGAQTPVYTFGTSDAQILRFEFEGILLVDASVVNMPLLTCGLGIVTDGMKTAFNVRFENNSSETLVLNKVGYITKATGASGWLETTLTLAGTGNFRLAGALTSMNGWQVKPTFSARKVTVVADWTSLHGLVLSRAAGHTLELENGAMVAMGDSWCQLTVNYDAEIIGNGTVRMASSNRGGTVGWYDGEINIAENRTLTLGANVTLTNSKSDSTWIGKATRIGAGVLVINGPNTMPGSILLHGGITRVSNISQLGGTAAGMDLIVVRGGARLVYTGAGETTARTVVMTNGNAIVEQAGTGPLVMNGAMTTLAGKTGMLTLVNASNADATWNGVIPSDVTGVTVQGDGGWTLAGANGVQSYTIAGGGRLCLTGDAATAGVATVSTGSSGTGVLRVLDDETVTLAGLTSAGGTLNVVTEGSGKVVVPGQSGMAPGWLSLNGKNSEYEADGTLAVASYPTTTSIAARGDVVPNDATAMVGITSAGSGGADTLAADATAVAGLVQKADTPAIVEIAANQTLTADILAVNDGKASLAVGATAGTGTFAAGSAGTLTLDNENPDASLTIAAAADLSAATTVDKRGPGAVRFEGPVAPWNGTMMVNRGEVVLANDAQAAPAFALSGSATFAKEGAADWTLTKLQPDFTGDFVLRGGVTRLGSIDSRVLGATSATLTITNGAALDISGGLADGTFSQLRLGARHIRIAGNGPDGYGALRPEAYNAAAGASSGSTNNNGTLLYGGRITLLDDATIGMGVAGPVRFHLQGLSVIDQQFHTLTITNAGIFETSYMSITNAGPLVIAPGDDSINLLVEAAVNLGGADAPPITTHAKSLITLANNAPAQWRPVNVLSNLTFYNWHNYHPDDPAYNCWAGPISLSTPESLVTMNVYSQTDRTLRFAGQVSGPGGIKTSYGGRYFFSYPSNTWTGASSFLSNPQPGFWQFDYAGSLSVYSNATFAAGVVKLPMGTGDRWPADRLADFLNEANMAGNTIVELGTSEGDAHLDYSVRAVTNAMKGTLRNGGTGKLVISGPGDFPGSLKFDSAWTGVVEVTGSETVSISAAKPFAPATDGFTRMLAFRDADDVRLGNGKFLLNDTANAYGMLKVANSRLIYENILESTGGFQIGFRGTDIMDVTGDDTVITNLFNIGYYDTGHGAVYQRGGEVANVGMDGSHYGIVGGSSHSYGYYELSDGRYKMLGSHRVGFNLGNGILAIHGGEAECVVPEGLSSSCLNLGVDHSVGVLYMKGGTLRMGPASLSICEWNNTHHDGIGVISLDGPDARIVYDATFDRLGVSSNALAIVNLNAGVLETRTIARSVRSGNVPWVGAKVYVNFGGGTLKPSAANVNLFGTGLYEVDRVTSFAGGAVIDTAGSDRTVDVPIEAPEGMGVASVDGTGIIGETFVGPPIVLIENTGTSEGYGATAYADFDSVTRKVTGIHVTSPGCNYTSAQAVFRYGKPWITNVVTLAASPSGGITKKGEGTLTLNAANSFTGAVSVEGGTLKVGVDGALPSVAPVSLTAGGTLDLNGRSLSCSAISSTGGAVANGTLTLPAALTVDVAEAKAGNCLTFASGSFAFPANATLTLENTQAVNPDDKTYTLLKITGTGSFANLPRLTNDDLEPWTLTLGAGGREVRLAFPRGTLMIFR